MHSVNEFQGQGFNKLAGTQMAAESLAHTLITFMSQRPSWTLSGEGATPIEEVLMKYCNSHPAVKKYPIKDRLY